MFQMYSLGCLILADPCWRTPHLSTMRSIDECVEQWQLSPVTRHCGQSIELQPVDAVNMSISLAHGLSGTLSVQV